MKQNYDIPIISGDIVMGKYSRDTVFVDNDFR